MNPNKLSRLFPNASKSFKEANSEIGCISPGTILKQGIGKALHAAGKDEARSLGRYRVSFTCYRIRKQDPDNAVVKWFVDALRRAKIIPDDTEETIELQIKQILVGGKSEERTEIEVIPL